MAIKKNREQAQQERNSKIADMNLDELKPYLCLKYNRNPAKCDGCPSISGCTAGQRAVLLLARENIQPQDGHALETQITANTAQPEKAQDQPPEEPPQEPPKLKVYVRNLSRVMTEQDVRQAFSSPDPVQWMVDNLGRSRKAALKAVHFWADNHPELVGGYTYEKLSKEERARQNGRKRTEEAMRKYREALDSGRPVEYLMETYQMTLKQAKQAMSNWKSRYKQISKQEEEAQMSTETEEEISLTDFLQQVDTGTDPQEEEQPMETAVQDTGIRGQLNSKFELVEKREAEITRQMEALQKELEWCVKQKEALALVVNMFDPNTAIAKSLSME